jgi:protein-S-isoprenylcysteine O-methyltransferase Ste14
MVRGLTALVLYALAVAVTFGGRTVLQWRRYGDTGWRFHRTSVTGMVPQGLLVAGGGLVFGAAIAAIAGDGAHQPLGLAALTEARSAGATISTGLGVALAIGGTAFACLAQWQMGASWRIGVDAGERTALVTGGLYRWVRNPIYTGMGACFVGAALLVPNVFAGAALVAGWLGLELQVRRVEEPYLRATHGAAYLAWAATSGRFLPGIGRIRAGS